MKICNFLKQIFKKTIQQQASENFKDLQQTLMPIVIDKDTYPQYYHPVEEIGNKLTDKNVRNIALTGPYGSGKSSVLRTLQKDYPNYRYLQISLATLNAYDDPQDDQKVQSIYEEKDPELKADAEKINRLIEYSILQQLIYREKPETLPKSRFKRILHFDTYQLNAWAFGIILFCIAYLIAFEPTWLRVDSIYEFFSWGSTANIIFDFISVFYMFGFFFVCIKKILLAYYGHQVGRLNLKNGEIELKEASIFNKHLDEIIYFFRQAAYEVVIIEDLDRFNSPNIYLKLRELNQLINDSKEIRQRVVFIYAIKDDMFRDTQRTKFFDYITTVIPVINLFNSKDELKNALNYCGYRDFKKDDLEEMALFINDMRLLRNIVNEYHQYWKRLNTTGRTKLNKTKLLGMIVYKNCFPRDFAQLHNREGNVYQCIAARSKFETFALQRLAEQKSNLERKIDSYKQSRQLSKLLIRRSCAFEIVAKIPQKPTSIILDNESQSFRSIVDNEMLFEQLISTDQFTYQYRIETGYSNNIRSGNFNLKQCDIDFAASYWNRKKQIEELPREIRQEQVHLESEELRIKSAKLAYLLTEYNMEQCDDFTNIKLTPLMKVFLRQGYIDEDYEDYISYFYDDSITLSDRELLLIMKQGIRSDYSLRIDKVANFAKMAKLGIFNDASVLNNMLVDFLLEHSQEKVYAEKSKTLLKLIENSDVPLDFVTQYYLNGKQVKKLFEHFIGCNADEKWAKIIDIDNKSDRMMLIESWLKFCDPNNILDTTRIWLNEHYSFLTEHLTSIGLEQAKKLSENRKYTGLNTDSSDLLDTVIANNCYTLNKENLCLVVSYLNSSINEENLNLTRIKSLNSDSVVSYVEENLTQCLSFFSSTIHDENEDSLISILNDESITKSQKSDYLKHQRNRIGDITRVIDDSKEVAIDLYLILPTWKNVATYFSASNNTISRGLKLYIEYYATQLGNLTCEDSIREKNLLFKYLINSNLLNIDCFRQLTASFDNTIAAVNTDIEPGRLDYLINIDKIEYTEENTNIISDFDVATYANYLICHKEEYLEEAEDFTYSAELALHLISSSAFTIDEKAIIISSLDVDFIEQDQNLATEICALVAKAGIDLDEDVLKVAIENSLNIEDRVTVASNIMEKNINDILLIEDLLHLLSSEYDKIAKRDRTHPKLEKTDYNIRLLDILVTSGYISTYTPSDKDLKINKKYSFIEK